MTLSILSSLSLLPFPGVLEHSTKTCFPFHLFMLRKSWQTSELLKPPRGHAPVVMLSFLIFLCNFSWVCVYLCRHTQSEARGAMVIFWSNFSRIQTGIFSPPASCFPLHICLCKVILHSVLYSQNGSCISCLDVRLSFFLLHIDNDIYLFNLLLFCNSSLPDIFLHLNPTCVNISVLTHSHRCCRCCHHSTPLV